MSLELTALLVLHTEQQFKAIRDYQSWSFRVDGNRHFGTIAAVHLVALDQFTGISHEWRSRVRLEADKRTTQAHTNID